MFCFMLMFWSKSLSPLCGQFIFIFIIADLNLTNLFDLSYDQINAMKKKDLVNHIKSLKGKVTIDATIIVLSEQPYDRT